MFLNKKYAAKFNNETLIHESGINLHEKIPFGKIIDKLGNSEQRKIYFPF